MNIIVFHQPYPQGNYKLNEHVAKHLKEQGHTVYLLQQLNGLTCTEEFVEEIKSVQPDVLYFEMLDRETFKAVEQLDCKKVLVYASRGILPNFEEIANYYGKWFTHIYTNSINLHKSFVSKNIPSEHFEYYFSCLTDNECVFTPEYFNDCVFLGMGFARVNDKHYESERNLFFEGIPNIKFAIYGNGWPNLPHYRGLLPSDDIGKLYSSARSAIGIIGSGQRSMGMINNRYTEMMYCGIPVFSLNYKTIDWFGGNEYINFIENKNDIIELLKTDVLKTKAQESKKFIRQKHQDFFNKLNNIIK